MAIELKMPALSPTMEEGTLAKWLVKEGDIVKSGDILAEIETDKATMEFEAVDEGVISSITVAEGTDGVKVGTVIALILSEDEEQDDDVYFGLPKARSKGSKKRKNGTESNSRSINNNNKLTTMQGSRKNKKRLMKASIIERTLEINMPCISNKIAIGLERNTFIEP
jgi:pyruvate/2-oxoglutarate dehydrogenase complex dihydrolipoamide acyltransferase (E2) component